MLENFALVFNYMQMLPFVLHASLNKFNLHCILIYYFSKTITKYVVHFHTNTNDLTGLGFVNYLFHKLGIKN